LILKSFSKLSNKRVRCFLCWPRSNCCYYFELKFLVLVSGQRHLRFLSCFLSPKSE